jgi:hypothetical protein
MAPNQNHKKLLKRTYAAMTKVQDIVDELLASSPAEEEEDDQPWGAAHQELVRCAQKVTQKLLDHPTTGEVPEGDRGEEQEQEQLPDDVRQLLETGKRVRRRVEVQVSAEDETVSPGLLIFTRLNRRAGE